MKRKPLVLVPLVFVLASCSIKTQDPVNPPDPVVDKEAEKQNSTNQNDKKDFVSDIPDTEDLYNADYYKNIKVGTLDLENRTIENKESVVYEDLFNLANKVTISIDIDNQELEKIQADYETHLKTDVYRYCNSVTITLVNNNNEFSWTYEDVGIRQKGNTSRKDVFKDGEICGLNHFKLSFDETFEYSNISGAYSVDWTGKENQKKEREDRQFLGLSGLDIKWNKNYDTTHIKEIYASKLYKACGLLTQDIGLCDFKIKTSNKSYDFGVCTLYEPASKSLIKRTLQAGGLLNLPSWKEEKNGTYGVESSNYGDLYKATWGVGEGYISGGPNLSVGSTSGKKVGVKNQDGSYIPAYDRKTNKDVNYNDTQLKTLADKVTNGTYSDLEELMDLDYFAVVMACNYIVGNPDDLRYDNNNYMLYFSRINGKCYYIQIDNDRCFGITEGWNPDGSGLKNQGVFDSTIFAKGAKGVSDLLKKTILAKTKNRAKAIYLNYVKAIKCSDFIKEEAFNSLYEIAKNTYQSSVTSSFNTIDFNLNDTNNLTYHEYITAKLAKIDLEMVLADDNQPNNQNIDEYYLGEVQIVGNFCNWQGTDYPLTYYGNGIYKVTLTLTQGTEFKFYNNGWDNLNWGCEKGSEDPHKLSLKSGDNFKLTGITKQCSVEITVDVKNLTCNWVINE